MGLPPHLRAARAAQAMKAASPAPSNPDTSCHEQISDSSLVVVASTAATSRHEEENGDNSLLFTLTEATSSPDSEFEVFAPVTPPAIFSQHFDSAGELSCALPLLLSGIERLTVLCDSFVLSNATLREEVAAEKRFLQEEFVVFPSPVTCSANQSDASSPDEESATQRPSLEERVATNECTTDIIGLVLKQYDDRMKDLSSRNSILEALLTQQAERSDMLGAVVMQKAERIFALEARLKDHCKSCNTAPTTSTAKTSADAPSATCIPFQAFQVDGAKNKKALSGMGVIDVEKTVPLSPGASESLLPLRPFGDSDTESSAWISGSDARVWGNSDIGSVTFETSDSCAPLQQNPTLMSGISPQSSVQVLRKSSP